MAKNKEENSQFVSAIVGQTPTDMKPDWIAYMDDETGMVLAVNYDCARIRPKLRKEYNTYEKAKELVDGLREEDDNLIKDFYHGAQYFKNTNGRNNYVFFEEYEGDGAVWWCKKSMGDPAKLKAREK